MVYIDKDGAAIENPDLTLGYLEDAEWIDHPETPEAGHYEYEELKGGGQLQRYIVETPYEAAWREVTVQRYIPYTQDQLDAIARSDYAARLDALETQTKNHGDLLTAIEEGITYA